MLILTHIFIFSKREEKNYLLDGYSLKKILSWRNFIKTIFEHYLYVKIELILLINFSEMSFLTPLPAAFL